MAKAKTYSTKEAAKLAGIHFITLHRWLAAKKIRPSIAVETGGPAFYRWTAADVQRARRLARPQKNGRTKQRSKK